MEPAVTEAQVAPPKKQKKLKPARKQVKQGDVEKKEAPQSGKEYSTYTRVRYINEYQLIYDRYLV